MRKLSPARRRRFSLDPALRVTSPRLIGTATPPWRAKVALNRSGAALKPPAAAIASEMRQLGPISNKPGALTAPETATRCGRVCKIATVTVGSLSWRRKPWRICAVICPTVLPDATMEPTKGRRMRPPGSISMRSALSSGWRSTVTLKTSCGPKR